MNNKISETVTENIFRTFHGSTTFIEKSAIPNQYGFVSKKWTGFKGYPDFFKDEQDFCIIVEAKAIDQINAEEEVKFYMENNKINKDILGIALSGQTENSLTVTYYYRALGATEIQRIEFVKNNLVNVLNLKKVYNKQKFGDSITTEKLISVLKGLNNKFHKDSKVRATDRSLFFSGLMIALNSNNFRTTYKTIQAPTTEETASTNAVVLESHHLNN